MYVEVNDKNEIVQIIQTASGEMPEGNWHEVDDIPEDILKNIFSFKYVGGKFVPVEGIEDKKLQRLKEAKISKMSEMCHTQIISGFDHTDGHHYSLRETDQLNLRTLSLMAAQGQTTSWKYDGGKYQFYTPEDMLALTEYASKFIMYHTAYYNQLKDQIRNLSSPDEVVSVNYGMSLDTAHTAELSAHTGGFVPRDLTAIVDDSDYQYLIEDVDVSELHLGVSV